MDRWVSYFKTGILFAVLTSLLIVIGYILLGRNGILIFFIFSLIMNLGGYWFSDKIALSMSGAQPLSESEAPELYQDIKYLADRMQIPMPKIYITPDLQANAFATGRNPQHSSVAVTQGIMRILNRDELRGVLAHEMSHVKNRDILISTLAAVIAGAISGIAQIGMFFGGVDDENKNPFASLLLVILAPIGALLIQLAISRSREYAADESGSEYTGRPKDLANALIKIENTIKQAPININPALSSLYIESPLNEEGFSRLFSTHPSTSDRVARLYQLDNHIHNQ